MKAFFFTGWLSQFQKGQIVDACSSMIVYGGEEEGSWKAFEKWLLAPNQADPPVETKIEKIIGSPVLDQLLTESGFAALNWPDVCEELERILESTAPDDLSQGYWVDGNELVNPRQLSPNLEWLRRDLPEDIASALNWSADKTYFFLLSVLGPPEDSFRGLPEPESEPERFGEEDEDEILPEESERTPPFPEVSPRELSVVIRARNSVVAAWLWRKNGAAAIDALEIAQKPIRIDPLCMALPVSASER